MTYSQYLALPADVRAEYDRWFWSSFVLLLGGNINMIDPLDPVHTRDDDRFDDEHGEMGR